MESEVLTRQVNLGLHRECHVAEEKGMDQRGCCVTKICMFPAAVVTDHHKRHLTGGVRSPGGLGWHLCSRSQGLQSNCWLAPAPTCSLWTGGLESTSLLILGVGGIRFLVVSGLTSPLPC